MKSLSYNQYAKGFERMFKELGIKIAYKTKPTLKLLLGNLKDKTVLRRLEQRYN